MFLKLPKLTLDFKLGIDGDRYLHVLFVRISLNLLHSGRPKLYTLLAFLSAKGLIGFYVIIVTVVYYTTNIKPSKNI